MVLKTQDNKNPMDDEVRRQFEEELRKLAERFGITINSLKNFGEAAKKGSAEFKKSLEELNKEIKRGRAGYADQLRALEALNDAIEELADTGEEGAKKQKLLQDREQLAREAANQMIKESAQEFGKSLANTATRSTGQFVRQLQVGASGTELSSTIMNAAIEATASTLNFASKATEGFGRELLNTQGWLSQTVGAVLLGLGKTGEFVSESGEKALKFANEVLSKELEKTEKAFNTVNAAGAVFAGGMSAMREASVGAGLNLQQFSNIISKQAGDLAYSGAGVAEGARKVGQVGKIFDANGGYIRKQMQRLGFGFEEQAELTATVMGRMARMGQSFNAEKLARETQVYAENLRIIAAVTGEDAKAKLAQVEKNNNILAFQNRIAQIGGEQAAHINDMMATLSAADERSVRDLVINQGAHADTQSAMYGAMNTAAEAQNKQIANMILQGRATMADIGRVQSQFADGIIQGSRNLTEIGVAAFDTGDAALTGVSADLLDSLQHAQKIRDGAFNKVQDDIDKGKKPTDELTEGMIKASTAAQKLSVALEDTLLPLLKKYADATGTMLTGLKNIISTIYGNKPPVSPGGYEGGTSQSNPNAGGVGGGFDPNYFVKGPTESDTAYATRMREYAERQNSIASPTAPKGKALGGISTGPISGYSEVLHGTEAVVPLPDNRSIPVSLDSSSITAAVHQQTGVLTEILRAMQNNNNIASQIAMNTV